MKSIGPRGPLVVHAFAAGGGMVVGLVLPAVLAGVIDEAARGVVARGLWLLLLLLALRTVLGAASSLSAAAFAAREKFLRQREVAQKAMRQGITGRLTFDTGVVETRRGDASTVAAAPTFFVGLALRSIEALVAFVLLIALQWTLAVGGIFVLVAGAVVMATAVSGLNRGFEELTTRTERVAQRYADAIRGRRTIAAGGLFAGELLRVGAAAEEVAHADGEVRAAQGKAMSGVGTMAVLSFGVSATLGVWLLGRGRITVGELVAATLYVQIFTGAVAANFSEGWFQVPWYRVVMRRHREFVDSPDVLPEPGVPTQLPDGPLDVSLEEVTVKGAEAAILRDVDLRVGPGQVVALVGRSGVGKSTLAALVGRLLDPDLGQVTLGSVDTREICRGELASAVAYAFERPARLGNSIREFITLNDPYDDNEVWRALDAAAARDFVERLPHGLDEDTTSAPFSGGEWQRLGIARAAIREAPVLIMDDPTSSLDTITEAVIKQRLGALTSGRTVLIVAHRASMAAWADEVLWIREGELAARGSHATLWEDADYREAFGVK